MLAAEHQFRLSQTDKNGVSQREHLEQVAKAMGRAPDALFGPQMPDVALHVWEAFLDLHKGRTYGMGGPNPLTHEGIVAWCNLTGIALSLWELEVIRELDMLWVRMMNEDKG